MGGSMLLTALTVLLMGSLSASSAPYPAPPQSLNQPGQPVAYVRLPLPEAHNQFTAGSQQAPLQAPPAAAASPAGNLLDRQQPAGPAGRVNVNNRPNDGKVVANVFNGQMSPTGANNQAGAADARPAGNIGGDFVFTSGTDASSPRTDSSPRAMKSPTRPTKRARVEETPVEILPYGSYARESGQVNKPLRRLQEKRARRKEQKAVKRKLLDIADRATAHLQEDAPLLRLNPQTGKYEPVQVNPNALAYKEQLHQALTALSSSKLPLDKLKRVLMAGEDLVPDPSRERPASTPSGQQGGKVAAGPLVGSNGAQAPPASQAPAQEELARRQAQLHEEQRLQQERLLEQQRLEREQLERQRIQREQQLEQQRVQMERQRQEQERERERQMELERQRHLEEMGRQRQIELDQHRQLVEDVRGTLHDRLERISDLLYFRPEFMNEMLQVEDEHELTPLESVFKRLVLCHSDEQFCTQDLEQQMAGDAYVDEDVDGGEGAPVPEPTLPGYHEQMSGQFYPDHTMQDMPYGVPGQFEPVQAEHPLPAPAAPLPEVQVANGGYRRRSSSSSSNSYYYNSSTGGAGEPSKPPIVQHYQNSYASTQQGPYPAAASKPVPPAAIRSPNVHGAEQAAPATNTVGQRQAGSGNNLAGQATVAHSVIGAPVVSGVQGGFGGAKQG